MTNKELEIELAGTIAAERRITKKLLVLLNEAEARKLHLERGYASVFDWLVRGFGYSESAAYRRMEAARMARAVPGAIEKLEDGKLNLTTLAKARKFIRTQEKISGQKVSTQLQAQALERIENKSTPQAEVELLSLFPDTAGEIQNEKRIAINPETTRLALNLPNDVLADMEWVKNCLSHSIPDGDLAKVIGHVFKSFRTSAAKKQGVALARTDRRCEYVDPETGVRCTSTYQAQTDHVVPKALGGADQPENLRGLCAQHNRFMAAKLMPWWEPPRPRL